MTPNTFSMGASIRIAFVAPGIISPRADSLRVARLFIEPMGRLDVANGAGLGAHHHRVSFDSSAEEAHSLEKVSAGNPRRCKHHFALGQLFGGVDPVDVVDSHLFGP